MTRQDLDAFDDIYRSEGGRLSLPDEPEVQWLNNYLEVARQHFAGMAKPTDDVVVDYVNNPQLNASVVKSNGVHYVGLYSGFLPIISILSRGLMRSRSLYRTIGTARFESEDLCEWLRPVSGHLWTLGPSVRQHTLQQLEAKPADAERLRWSEYFHNWAWRLLIYHESAHAFFGHFDILGNVGSSIRLYETAAIRSDNALTFQALEMEADAFAASLLYADLEKPLGNESVAIHAAISAIFWMTLLFEVRDARLEDYRAYDHPHPAVRYLSMMRAAIAEPETLAHWDPAVVKRWQTIMPEALADGLIAAGKLGHSNAVLGWFAQFSTTREFAVESLVEETCRIRSEVRRLVALRS